MLCDARQAVKALIVANHYLETDLGQKKSPTKTGFRYFAQSALRSYFFATASAID